MNKTKTQQKYEKDLDMFAYEMSKGSLYVQLKSAKIVLGKALQEQEEELRDTILKDDELVNNWIEENTKEQLQAQKEKFENFLRTNVNNGVERYEMWREIYDKEALNNQSPQLNTKSELREHSSEKQLQGNILNKSLAINEDKAPKPSNTTPVFKAEMGNQEVRGSNICKCGHRKMVHSTKDFYCFGFTCNCKKFTPRGKNDN